MSAADARPARAMAPPMNEQTACLRAARQGPLRYRAATVRERVLPRAPEVWPLPGAGRTTTIHQPGYLRVPPTTASHARLCHNLNNPQLFAGGRQHLAAGRGDHHGILDPDAAEPFQINAGLDGDRHARGQRGFVLLADAR